jgi:uncharacterized membrane protein (Fun14 family)
VVSILAPDTSIAFWVALLLPLVLGIIVGLIVKSVIKIGLALAILAVILIFLGIVTPDQVLQPILSLAKQGPALTAEVQRLSGFLPYSSATFIIGLAIGFFKG